MPDPRWTSPSPHAFSLVELLVVIGVIVLLVGLLFPALASSRDAGRTAVCLSNARQLQLAGDLYAADFAAHYAPAMPDRLANLTRWHGARATINDPFSPTGGPLSAYIAAPASTQRTAQGSIRDCPAFARTLESLAAAPPPHGFERGSAGYGYNAAYVGAIRKKTAPETHELVTDLSGAPQHAFARPSSTIAFADAAIADGTLSTGGLAEYSFLEPRFWPEQPGQRADPSMHFRHGRSTSRSATAGAASAVHLDGHAAALKRTFTWSSGFYPADPAKLALGWPGAADTNTLFHGE